LNLKAGTTQTPETKHPKAHIKHCKYKQKTH